MPKTIRLKFSLDRLKVPPSQFFRTTIGGTFASLLALDDDVEAMTTSFTAKVTETANGMLGKYRRKSQTWVTKRILEMCDIRRNLKRLKNTTDKEDYRKINKMIRKNEENQREMD